MEGSRFGAMNSLEESHTVEKIPTTRAIENENPVANSKKNTSNKNNSAEMLLFKKRLENWEDDLFETKMKVVRQTFGIGEPIRRGMELEIIRAEDSVSGSGLLRDFTSNAHESVFNRFDKFNNNNSSQTSIFGCSNSRPSVHQDILLNRDTKLDWEDVFTGSS